MSKILNLAIGAALGVAASAPLYAADAARTEAWSDAQVKAAMDKCHTLPADQQGKCITNIRPVTSRTTVMNNEENTVKSGKYTEEEYSAAIKKCDAPSVNDKEGCIANVKDHYGRM